jgi:hypothetical protein
MRQVTKVRQLDNGTGAAAAGCCETQFGSTWPGPSRPRKAERSLTRDHHKTRWKGSAPVIHEHPVLLLAQGGSNVLMLWDLHHNLSTLPCPLLCVWVVHGAKPAHSRLSTPQALLSHHAPAEPAVRCRIPSRHAPPHHHTSHGLPTALRLAACRATGSQARA